MTKIIAGRDFVRIELPIRFGLRQKQVPVEEGDATILLTAQGWRVSSLRHRASGLIMTDQTLSEDHASYFEQRAEPNVFVNEAS